jgi:hypothetical protein
MVNVHFPRPNMRQTTTTSPSSPPESTAVASNGKDDDIQGTFSDAIRL